MNGRRIFHLVCSVYYIFICISDYVIADPKYLPIPHQFLSKFVWLTLIDLYLQTIYHIVGVFITSRNPSRLYDLVGHTLIGPIGATVVLLFWILYLFDPNTLLADDNAKAIIAISWFNHGIHTLPLVTSIIEILLWKRQTPKWKSALMIIGVFAAIYVADIHYVHHISGFWAYPILGFLSLPFRILFIVVCIGVIFFNYSILSLIHNMAHQQTKQPEHNYAFVDYQAGESDIYLDMDIFFIFRCKTSASAGSQLLYLFSFIFLVIVSIFSVLSCLSSAFRPFSFLKKYLDQSLVTTIFPSSIVTCGLFWGLYAIEPELVMPAWIRQLIPSWLNHVTHTLPIIYVLFELFCEERHTVTAKGRLIMSFILVFFYFKVIFVVKYLHGYWLYPLLEVLEPFHFIGSFLAAVGGFYMLTQLANSLLQPSIRGMKLKKY